LEEEDEIKLYEEDMVDCMTKDAHFYALAHPFIAKEVVVLFFKEVVCLHGFPSSIVSDQDKIFMSTFGFEVFKQADTPIKMFSAYHPQTDGQTEAVNECLETYLRCLTGTKPKLSWFNQDVPHSKLCMDVNPCHC